jgi:hypothetical protein
MTSTLSAAALYGPSTAIVTFKPWALSLAVPA